MAEERNFWRENGLSLVFLGLFAACLLGQAFTGVKAFNDSRMSHGLAAVSLGGYLRTGTFLDGIFVNWQAAVLQLAALIVFGSVLFQRGATHSKKPEDGPGGQTRDRKPHGWIYSHSLSLAFLFLFVVTFALHSVFGTWAYNEQAALTRSATMTVSAFLGSAEFWTSTLSCWQAEMFAIFAYVVFSIFLRQKGSPESKPSDSDDDETGEANK